jgi:hypothetical protein
VELTQFQTFFPPAATLGTNNEPLGIARATVNKPARILVDNIGATLVFLAGTRSDAFGPEGPSSATFRLLAGRSQVFVLAPEQVLYCIGSGAGAIVSVTGSDAIPLGWERDDKGHFFPANDGRKKGPINPAYPGKGTGA